MIGPASRLYWRRVKRREMARAAGFWSGLDLIPRQAALEARTGRAIDRFIARPGNRRVPDFVIIGVPKSATSWLRAALDHHPQIATVREEIEFLSSNIEIGLNAYLRHFAEGSPALAAAHANKDSHESLKLGEKSASLAATSEDRIRLMHRLMPEARLILMLRDPVERHWAQAKRHFSKSRYGKDAFDIRRIDEEEFKTFFRATLRFSAYSEMIERWRGVFGREALLILWQEDAAANPAAVLDLAFRHIGVDPARLDAGGIVTDRNRGPSMPMTPRIRTRLQKMLAPEYARLEALLGDELPAWWRRVEAPARQRAGSKRKRGKG